MWTKVKAFLAVLKDKLGCCVTKLKAHNLTRSESTRTHCADTPSFPIRLFTWRAFADTVGLILISAVLLSFFFKPNHQEAEPNMQVAVIATPAPAVKNQPKVAVTIKKPVKVYQHSGEIKSHIKLPAAVIENPNELVLQSSIVPGNDDHPHSVTTTINAETGETQTYVKTEPLPWVAWDKRGSAGIYVGFKNANPAVRLQVKQDFADVKAIRLGVNASIDQVSTGQTDLFVGVGASYNW